VLTLIQIFPQILNVLISSMRVTCVMHLTFLRIMRYESKITKYKASGYALFCILSVSPFSDTDAPTYAISSYAVSDLRYCQQDGQCNEARSRDHWCCGKAITITYSKFVSVFILNYPTCKALAPYYIVICVLSDSTIFSHIIS
jgi:hypothetical protein